MAFSIGGSAGSNPIQGSGEGEKKPDPKGILKTPGGKHEVSLSPDKVKNTKIPAGIVQKNKTFFEQKAGNAQMSSTVKSDGFRLVTAKRVLINSDDDIDTEGEQAVKTAAEVLLDRVSANLLDVKTNVEEGSVAIIQDAKASKAEKNKCIQAIRNLISRIRNLLIRLKDKIIHLFSKKGEDFVEKTRKDMSYVQQWVDSLPEDGRENDIFGTTQGKEVMVSDIGPQETSKDRGVNIVLALQGIEDDLNAILKE